MSEGEASAESTSIAATTINTRTAEQVERQARVAARAGRPIVVMRMRHPPSHSWHRPAPHPHSSLPHIQSPSPQVNSNRAQVDYWVQRALTFLASSSTTPANSMSRVISRRMGALFSPMPAGGGPCMF